MTNPTKLSASELRENLLVAGQLLGEGLPSIFDSDFAQHCIYEELIRPMCSHYLKNSNRSVRLVNGFDLKIINLQYAFFCEDDIFQPILWEEEYGDKIIGFTVRTHPDVLLIDMQYSDSDELMILGFRMCDICVRNHHLHILFYQGFGDQYSREGN